MKDYSLERCHCASSNCYCANIKRAENKITALYNRHLEKAGITRGQYALLANIERNRHQRQRPGRDNGPGAHYPGTQPETS